MENQILLEIADISKAFGITKACQNISFTINKGEIHGLIGENGSGKSTLTSMIYGLQPQGNLFFLEKNIGLLISWRQILWEFQLSFRKQEH